jgi:hypothetical protein
MRPLLHLPAFFTIPLILLSCDVKEIVQPYVNHSFYLQLKIADERINYEDDVLGMQNTAIRSTTAYDTTVLEKQSSFFSGDGTISNVADVTISQYKILPAPDTLQKDVDSLFTVGDYTYKNATYKEGIEITIKDGGITWSTSSGTADQTGSNFTITKHDFEGTSTYRYATYGSFVCKVYNGAGNVKLINGTFKLKTITKINI